MSSDHAIEQKPTEVGAHAAFSSSEAVKPGQVLLGQYLVKRKLGEGGMGSVWLVEDQVLKTDRALKLIAASVADIPEVRARFQREAQVMARLKNDHAVTVHTAQVVGTMAAIVMEYISGESLDRILQPGRPMPLDWVGRVLVQLCGCLQAAHHQGIVHRDLKPSNLMLAAGRPNGEVFLKVLDFGLAKILGAKPSEAITQAKGALGTAAYISPEQALGKDVSNRTDIYSMGVILYELLTGYRPFKNGPQYRLMNDHVNTPPPRFSQTAPGCRVPAEVERLVMRCLEKDPASRPASARAVAESFLKATTTAVDPSTTTPETKSTPGRPAWMGAAISGLTIVFVGGLLAFVPALREVIVGSARGAVHPRFDAPIEGLEFKIDGTPVGKPPWTLTAGPHELVVNQGIYEAAKLPLTVRAGEETDVPVGITRRETVPVHPESARVLINGSEQVLENGGQVALKFSGSAPVQIKAVAEGYLPYSRSLAHEDVTRPNFEIRLLPDERLAEEARVLLQKYCHRCHGVEFNAAGLDVLDRRAMVALRGSGGTPYLVPGQPGKSAIWLQIERGKMPPKDASRPTAAEIGRIKTWIAAGSPAARGPRRTFLSSRSALAGIRDDLAKLPPGKQRFQRYFTLTNVYNNPEVRDDELVIYRAALSKAINSLSSKPLIVLPKAIDREATIYRLDLSDVGWEGFDHLWPEIFRRYPYGLRPDRGRGVDPAVKELVQEIIDKVRDTQFLLRADWFIARATRPPLYDTLLVLPASAADLERERVHVNIDDDFKSDRAVRVGVTSSNVLSHPSQNRLVERHANDRGDPYWRTYDFRHGAEASDLLQFPLGPAFEGNTYPAQAFKQAISAIIFSLPNGLQGYMLVDAAGNRINEAPSDVLKDPQATAGSPQVVNGISCMSCHRLGVIRAKDEVRHNHVVSNEAGQKVLRLFLPHDEADRLMIADIVRFLQGMKSAVGPFLSSSDQDLTTVANFPEPIGFVARRFHYDLTLSDVATELGVEEAEGLAGQIREMPALLQRGLGPLAAGSTIKRAAWEQVGDGVSLFQRTARELGLGAPAAEP
jgi:serine/threonine-protein kinase